jgi:hypothetical protein
MDILETAERNTGIGTMGIVIVGQNGATGSLLGAIELRLKSENLPRLLSVKPSFYVRSSDSHALVLVGHS